MDEQPVSFSHFARMIGISQPAVSQHVREGIISKRSLKKIGKRTKIFPESAMADLEANVDPGLQKWKRPEPIEYGWDITDAEETVRRIDRAINTIAFVCHCLTDPQMKSEITGGLDTIVNVLNGK